MTDSGDDLQMPEIPDRIFLKELQLGLNRRLGLCFYEDILLELRLTRLAFRKTTDLHLSGAGSFHIRASMNLAERLAMGQFSHPGFEKGSELRLPFYT